MVWRSWVRTLVESNLGCIVLMYCTWTKNQVLCRTNVWWMWKKESFNTSYSIILLLCAHNNTVKKTIIRLLEIFTLFASSKKHKNYKHEKNGKWVTCIRAIDVWRKNYKHANCLVGLFRENFTPRNIDVLQYYMYVPCLEGPWWLSV